MPIPPFNSDSVLPPHLGDPTRFDQLSPYPCTSLELCQAFTTSRERKTILEGFLNFREELQKAGVTAGFQWLDGSFLEDIEHTQGRPPRDLDLVTFYMPTDVHLNSRLAAGFPAFANRVLCKNTFHLDHFPVDMGHNGFLTVEITRYWTGLFSHRRDSVWKGMLRIDLNTPAVDTDARIYLQNTNP